MSNSPAILPHREVLSSRIDAPAAESPQLPKSIHAAAQRDVAAVKSRFAAAG